MSPVLKDQNEMNIIGLLLITTEYENDNEIHKIYEITDEGEWKPRRVDG